MSRNFPTWEDTHWDYEKGNLNDATKKYAVEACRRVKAAGGCGPLLRRRPRCSSRRTSAGSRTSRRPATRSATTPTTTSTCWRRRPEDIQFRFRRSPWLIEGSTPEQVIVENIRLTTAALKTRIGVDPAGFRTPGGFADGLADRAGRAADGSATWASPGSAASTRRTR